MAWYPDHDGGTLWFADMPGGAEGAGCDTPGGAAIPGDALGADCGMSGGAGGAEFDVDGFG